MVRAANVRYLAKYAAQSAAITLKYTDYKLGRNQPVRKAPARGASVKVALASFDTRATTKNTIVTASGRAMLAGTRTATGATDLLLNIEATTIPETAKRVVGFKPAKITIFIPEIGGLTGAPVPAFASFCKANADNNTNICKIYRCEWSVNSGGIVFHVAADRFLRNMVRAIVGTLVDVGRGKLRPEDLRGIIESKNRSNAGPSVPACGLYLTKVNYNYIDHGR